MPSPGDLPNLGIEPSSPALQADSLPAELPGKLWQYKAERKEHLENMEDVKNMKNVENVVACPIFFLLFCSADRDPILPCMAEC